MIILKSLPVIFLSLLAFLGFGFLFAGLVMLLKNIGPFAQLFEFGMLFFSGVFFPLTLMPNWVRSFAEFIPLLMQSQLSEPYSLEVDIHRPPALLGGWSFLPHCTG